MKLNYDDDTAPNSAKRFYELAPTLSDIELAVIFRCSVYTVRRLRTKKNERPITGARAHRKRYIIDDSCRGYMPQLNESRKNS